MVIAPPPATRLEKDLLENAERLRGGGVGCACCGGGGDQPSPLEPQPPQSLPPQSQPNPPQTTQTARKEQPSKPAGGREPRLSEPTPSHAARARMASTAPVSTQSSLAPPRSETGRAHSSPTSPSTLPPTTSHPNTRGRYVTLPSKLPPTQQASTSSPGPPTILEGPIHYPGGTIRSPAFPPSVPSGGSRAAASGPPAAQAPFMKD